MTHAQATLPAADGSLERIETSPPTTDGALSRSVAGNASGIARESGDLESAKRVSGTEMEKDGSAGIGHGHDNKKLLRFHERLEETFMGSSSSSISVTDNDNDDATLSDYSSSLRSKNSTASTVLRTACITCPCAISTVCLRRCTCRSIRRRCHCVLLLLALLFVGLWGMAEYQRYQTLNMPSTKSLYQSGSFCVREDTDDGLSFLTKNSIVDGEDDVAHCGDCGSCSNPHDMKIYDDTKSTLFHDSLACSKKFVVGGAEAVRECLDDNVGFTEDCNDCWVDNIMCDVENCLFICMWHALFHTVNDDSGGNTQQALNACTQCDERRCGPDFLRCAGANRRRSGIMSEFQRDTDNVCREVQVGWWQDADLQERYRIQEGL